MLVQLSDRLSNHSEPSAMLRQTANTGRDPRGISIEEIDVPTLLHEIDAELSQTIEILTIPDRQPASESSGRATSPDR